MIKKIAIIGGGTAGWMTAAALSKTLPRGCEITLVESDEIGTVGVGEATIVPIRQFNNLLQVREDEFLKAVGGTFKTGIKFVGWGKEDSSYFHPFALDDHGPLRISMVQHWIRAHLGGDDTPLDAIYPSALMAGEGKFDYPLDNPRGLPVQFSYAYHIDAGRWAMFLREYSEARGVKRIEGKVVAVSQNGESGFVESVSLERDEVVEADLFIDCTGFRSMLLGDTMRVPFVDWSHWLPCDRALAGPTKLEGPKPPYTLAEAHRAGWRWRIPLQHRMGNGVVYSSAFMSDDEAAALFLMRTGGEFTAPLNQLRFTAGRREKFWDKNVVAIGLSSGFLEPLESTSIHFIQSSIIRLLEFFPDKGFDQRNIDTYNRHVLPVVDNTRDFIIGHYHATQRTDSPFWDYCRTMELPDSAKASFEAFRETGFVPPVQGDLFGAHSWGVILMGQGVFPKKGHPLLAYDERSVTKIRDTAAKVTEMVAGMRSHDDYINFYCKAE